MTLRSAPFRLAAWLALLGLALVTALPLCIPPVRAAEEASAITSALIEHLPLQIVAWRRAVAAGHGSSRAETVFQAASHQEGAAMLSGLLAAADQAAADADALGEGVLCACYYLYATAGDQPAPDPALARAILERAVRGLGDQGDPVVMADLCMDLGIAFSTEGRGDRALELWRRALALLDRAALPALEPMKGQLYQRIGLQEVELGEYADAVTALRKALAVFQQQHLASGEAILWQSLGVAYARQERFDEARQAFQQAITLLIVLHDDEGVAEIWANLGGVYQDEGRYGEALEQYQQALVVFQRLGIEARIASVRQNIGLLYRAQGRYREAVEELEAALAVYLKDPEEMEVSIAQVWTNLGLVYGDTGRLEEAVQALGQAIEIYDRRRMVVDLAQTREDLGYIYTKQGRLPDAERAYREALAVYDARGLVAKGAEAWLNLGLVYQAQRKHEETVDALQRALTMYRQKGMESSEAIVWEVLGIEYEHQQQYAEAEAAYRRALAVFQRNKMEPRVAEIWLNLGALLENQGRYQEALGPLHQALSSFDGQGLPAGALVAHKNLMIAYQGAGRLQDARTHAKAALDLLDRGQREAFYSGGESAAIALGSRYEDLYAHAAVLDLAAQDPAAAFETVERGRGRLLSVTRLRAVMAATTPDAQAALAAVQHTQTQIAALQARMGRAASAGERRDLQAQLDSSEQQAETQEVALSRVTRTFELVHDPAVAELQAALPPKTALLEYAILPDGVHLFVVAPDGVHHFVVPQTRDALQSRLHEFVLALSKKPRTGHAGPAVRPMAKDLYRALFAPAEASLAGVEALVIVPEGPLQFLPFEALMDDAGRYVLERYTITYLNTARELVRKAAPAGSRDLVMGGAFYSLQPSAAGRTAVASATAAGTATRGRGLRNGGGEWPDLAATLDEAKEIAGILHATPLLEAEATETAFKRQAPGSRYVHVATHGYVTEDLPAPADQAAAGGAGGTTAASAVVGGVPDTAPPPGPVDSLKNCGIVFTGVNAGGDGENDGDLTAYEVLGLNLEGVKLVVLSACETGLGRVEGGEGVFGLKRAFLVAGAERLVLSLWQVSDEGTRTLMVEFFQRLARGVSTPQALREAKLSMLQAGGTLKEPFYWAPFILVGAP